MSNIELQLNEVVACGNDAGEELKINNDAVNHPTQSFPNELDINLGNRLKNIDITYEYNFRLVVFGLLALSLSVTGNLSFFTDAPLFRVLVIIYNAIIMMICLWLLVSSFKALSKAKRININISRVDFLSDFFNNLLNILKLKENVYNLYVQKAGFVAWGLVLNASMNTTMREIFYHLGDATGCGKGVETQRFRSLCAANNSVVYVTWIIMYAVVLLAIAFVTRSSEIFKAVEKEKSKVLEKYQHTNIKVIDDQISDMLITKWKSAQLAKNRKFEVVVLTIVCFIYHIGTYAVVRNKLFSGNIEFGVVVFALYMNIIDSITGVYFLFLVHTLIVHHFAFAELIMMELFDPINAKNIDYVIAWWELRQYYRFCVVDVYARGINVFIYMSLFTSNAFAILAIVTIGKFDNELILSFVTATIYAVCLSFFIVAPAVQYHQHQLSHSITINKEKLRMKRYALIKPNECEFSQREQEIVDIIIDDVKQNSKAMVVLGIKIDTAFMLFLRATAITFVIAIIIESI
eukprot:562386_1